MRTIKYTTKGSKDNIYECRIKLDDKNKIIIWMDCDCYNFQNRQIKRIGKVFISKFIANPCKHLKRQIEALSKQGYKFKEITFDKGLDKPNIKLKRQLLELFKNKCADCNSKDNLQFHRNIPGYLDGKYSLTNVVVVCNTCHKRRHSNEFT